MRGMRKNRDLHAKRRVDGGMRVRSQNSQSRYLAGEWAGGVRGELESVVKIVSGWASGHAGWTGVRC